MVDFSKVIGFDWDEGNREKNWQLHRVSWTEAEEVFSQHPLLVYPDPAHSDAEDRFYLLGRTNADRRLFIVFKVRESKIQVISARDMSRKERKVYDEALKENPEV